MNTDSLIIDIQSTSKDSTKNIDSLVESLENLSKALSDVISQSNSFKNLKNITSSVKSSNKINQQNIGTESRDAQLRQLNVGDFKSLEKNLLSETTSMDKVISKYKTGMGGIVTITEKATSAGQKFNVTLKQTHPQVKTLSEQLKNAQNVMGKLQAKMIALGAGLIGMVKKAVDFVDMASAEAEALNLFTVSMGEYAEEGTRWLEKFSNALYLDPVSVQQYMGSFNSLVKGLGVGSENAYKMSKNLTQLVYDLSSFKNISIESSYEKLMSGISGELEPLRNVGVAMSEATLQTLAYDLGIEKMVRNMTEAEKAQLRYIQIMRSSTEWQTDMGRTLITPANALRVMRQQFVQLGRAIGKVFIPIIMSAMPYVIAITQMLTALAQKLANFLGYEIADIDYSGLGDISAGITDIGTSADKTTEKLNTMLAPFDDLNVVQNQAKNASSGLGGIGGDLGVELPEYDALANLNEKFAEGVEKAKKNLEKLLPIVVAIGSAFALWKIGKSVVNLFSGITNISNGLKTLQKGITKLKGTKIASSATKLLTVITKISGVLVGLVTAIAGSKGLYNVVKKLTTGNKMCAQAFALLAGNIAETVAGTTLLGLAIGGPVGAGIGAITGLVLSGISAWKGYKDGIEEVAKSKVFGDINITTEQFSKALNNLKFSFSGTNAIIDEYNGKMSELGEGFEKSSLKVDSYLAKFQYLGESISGETGEMFKASLQTLFDDANAIIETGTQYSLDLWTSSFQGMTTMTAEEQGNVLRIVQENGSYVSEEMANAQNTINGIWSNAIATRGYLTEEEYNTIQEMLNKIRELTGQEMTKTQADVEYYKKVFGDKNYKLDEETYKNYLEARKKFESEQRSIIQDNYTTQYADLDKQLQILENRRKNANDTEKVNLDKQIKDIKKSQKDLYDTRVKSEEELDKKLEEINNDIAKGLKDQYHDLIGETNDFAKDQRKQIESVWKDLDLDMSSLKNAMKTSGNMCAKTFGEEFNKKQLQLKLNPNSKIGFDGATLPFRASWYAEGGYPTSGELFFANENGMPEMVGRIGNQTAVANNDQITTSITNALMSALNQYDFGGGKSPTTIYIGNKKVYEGYGDYVADENDRYGTNMIKI